MDYTYIRTNYDLDGEYITNQVVELLKECAVSCVGDVCTVYFQNELSQGEKVILDGIVEDARGKHPLSRKKNSRIEEVRLKTLSEESLGVPYNNYRFSVTPSAKSNWLAIVVASAGLTYPFTAPTGFDSIYSFQDANDVMAFFGASMTFLKYWEQSNEQLIISISACTTSEQLDAIVDDRSYPV